MPTTSKQSSHSQHLGAPTRTESSPPSAGSWWKSTGRESSRVLQFADTVAYLERELRASADSAKRSPRSPGRPPIRRRSPGASVRSSTTRGSGSARSRDCACCSRPTCSPRDRTCRTRRIIVNYDLPWAIIRLIQRVGRVDRIGQRPRRILCYSFLPADGVERILRLRARVRQRLPPERRGRGNRRAFFEDERGPRRALVDLYHEKSAVLDDEADEPTLISPRPPGRPGKTRSTPIRALEQQVAACPTWSIRLGRTSGARAARRGTCLSAHGGWYRRARLDRSGGATGQPIAARDLERRHLPP